MHGVGVHVDLGVWGQVEEACCVCAVCAVCVDLHSLVRSLVYLKECSSAKLCRSPESDKLN